MSQSNVVVKTSYKFKFVTSLDEVNGVWQNHFYEDALRPYD